jgi:Arc/MetJ-type ribon-helix-helix transcriptional regulator
VRSVKIPLKLAQKILEALEMNDLRNTAERLRFAIASTRPSRSVKAARVRRTQKKATKKAATALVREAVFARSEGTCECGCERPFSLGLRFDGIAEMDHFEGVARSESVETCWMLRADCHRRKHRDADPNSWRAKFINHCLRHGYRKTAEKVGAMVAADALIAEASSLSHGVTPNV